MKTLLFLAILVLAGCDRGGSGAPASPAAPTPAAPAAAAKAKPVDPAVLGRGKAIYDVHCAACHGAKGDGQGAAAYLLYPRPRDFTRGNYRLVSTADGTPTDDDLFRAITRGMPGSAMPSWAHLPESDRRALVAYVKSFNPDRFEGERERITVPPEPPNDTASVERGRVAYVASCQACHGPAGKGDGQQKMVDDDERPTRPRDLTRGIFKGDPSGRDLFLRIRAGLPGSPMPSNAGISATGTWDLVHYLRTLIPPGSEERGVQERQRILARRVEKAPTEPGDPAWAAAAAATEIVLMPLTWRDERVESVSVEALHDGKEVAFRLSWRGPHAEGPDAFRDGAAVQLATTAEEPSFAMGHAGAPVEILYWKSADPDAGRHTVDDGFEGSPERYPDLYAAREAGNPIAVPERRAVCRNEAAGFGTLATRPGALQTATGKGVFEKEGWQVTIVRPLGKPDGRSADVAPGGTRPVAFAVWQGAFQDRNGQKNVSIWHDLEIEK